MACNAQRSTVEQKAFEADRLPASAHGAKGIKRERIKEAY